MKKNILWICLGLIALAGLVFWGSVLTENLQMNMPSASDRPGQENGGNLAASQPVEEIPSESTELPADPTRPTPPAKVPPLREGEDLQARIEALSQEVYSLADYYVAQLAYLESEAHETFSELSEEEQTEENRRTIFIRCIKDVKNMEGACDDRVDEICNELGSLLLKTDGRMNLVSEVRFSYAKAKEPVKAGFLEKYADYFE